MAEYVDSSCNIGDFGNKNPNGVRNVCHWLQRNAAAHGNKAVLVGHAGWLHDFMKAYGGTSDKLEGGLLV